MNEEEIDSKCQKKTICKAGGRLIIIKLAHCPDNSECAIENGQRSCICKTGFYPSNGKCFPKGNKILITCRKHLRNQNSVFEYIQQNPMT